MTTSDIEHLFLRFSARYQRTWTSLFPTPEAYDVALSEWALILADVDTAGIERALKRCLVEFPTYPPKPAEFYALTWPTAIELGLPTLEEAYRAAINRRWRMHPLIWHTVAVIGQFEFPRLPSDKSRRRFEEIYHQLLQFVAEQRRIDPAFSLQLPDSHVPKLAYDKPKRITAPGDARVHIAAILQQLKRGGNSHDQKMP